MAILMVGHSKCSICQALVRSDESLFGTTHFLQQGHPLWEFSDSVMHWDCYASWPHRRKFAATYFKGWVEMEPRDPYWAKAFLDERVFVKVNPAPPIEAAHVWLAETGSRIDVPIARWEEWLADPGIVRSLHPLEAAGVSQSLPSIRDQLPDRHALVSSLDLDSKRQLTLKLEANRAAEQAERLNNVGLFNKVCAKMEHLRSEVGLSCPHCSLAGSDFRYVNNRRKGVRSYFVCPSCGGCFGPATAKLE